MLKSFLKALKSQVGRKVLSSVTGLFLIGFIVLHLSANLLAVNGPYALNIFQHGFDSLGWFMYALEIILAIAIVLHAYVGTSVWLRRRKHRPQGYKKYQSKGGGSHMNWLSRSMFYSGLITLAFIVWHVIQLRFGNPGMMMIHGQQMEDLRGLVVATFQQPAVVGAYAFVMIVFGFHLVHGFWSAFKSLSMKEGGFSSFIYGFGIFFAAVIAIGFLFIPLFIFFNGGA